MNRCLGDDLARIHDNDFNHPYDDGNSARCTGHVAHELGHVLGLGHEGPSDLCGFSEANVAKILADPDNEGWFEALPGETCTGLQRAR